MTSTALTPEAAQTIWTYLLPQVQGAHQVSRLLIQKFPADMLDVRPRSEGESFGDMLWYLSSVFHVFLDGVCEGHFAPLPAAPQPATTDSFLAWDDEHFSLTLQKLSQLTGEQLLAPVTFAGLTQLALDFVSSFLVNVSQHVGQLGAYLSMVLPTVPATTTAEASASGSAPAQAELSDEELSQVAGGANYILPPSSSSGSYLPAYTGNIKTNVHYNTASPIMVQTQAGLGSLLGNGAGGYGAFGAVGGAALVGAMLGIEAGMVAFGGAGVALLGTQGVVTAAMIISKF